MTSRNHNWTDRQDLPVGHPARAARRLPRRHGAGDSAHHQHHQGLDPRGLGRRRRRDRRDRRHRRRHREPALPRGHPPVPPGRRPRERALHPPDAGAVHRHRRRAQDQADAAQRPRPALDRHPARHPALPHRPPAAAGHQAQDRAVLRRRRGSRDHRARTCRASTRCRSCSAEEGIDRIVLKHLHLPATAADMHGLGDARRAHPAAAGRRHDPRRRQVRRPRGLLQEPARGARPRRLQARRQGQREVGRGRGARAGGRRQPPRRRARHPRAGRLRRPRHPRHDARGAHRADAADPVLRHLLRLPVGDGRVRARGLRHDRRRLDRVRARTRRPR